MVPRVDLRWQRAAAADRREVADALLTASLRDRGFEGAVLSRVCAWCGGAHGAVRVTGADAAASVSYAGELVVVATAAAPPDALFAIDAEPRELQPVALARTRAALEDPEADAATWTRVEAALKADGRGLRVDPGSVRLEASGEAWLAHVPGRHAPLRVVTLAGPPGVVVSLATGGERRSARPQFRAEKVGRALGLGAELRSRGSWRETRGR